MITINNLTQLFIGHLQGDLTDAEQQQLNQWLAQSERNRRLFESISNEEQLRQLILSYYQEEQDNNEAIIWSKVRTGIGKSRATTPVRPVNTRRRRILIAASLLLLAGMGSLGYFLLHNREKPGATVVAKEPADILPGREGAVLTLADGRQVVLDSLGNGVIATQNGAQVVLNNGALAYTRANGPAAPVYNHLTTPKGRQFQLLLPDGTKVWLNAASSLRYPTAFTGNSRQVEVTGEAYFEVARHKSKPFIVNILPLPGGMGGQVEVLGTRFNINAYTNEPVMKTTLLEGKVKVSALNQFESQPGKPDLKNQTQKTINQKLLLPGEQAVAAAHLPAGRQGSPLTIHHSPDIEGVMAWKNGLFDFEDASLEEVMRQIERWYDIEVIYEKGIPDIRFGGKVSRDVSLPGLLQSLRDSEVHFRIEGRKLIVLP